MLQKHLHDIEDTLTAKDIYDSNLKSKNAIKQVLHQMRDVEELMDEIDDQKAELQEKREVLTHVSDDDDNEALEELEKELDRMIQAEVQPPEPQSTPANPSPVAEVEQNPEPELA